MLSKHITCNTEGTKLIKFCEKNTFAILNGKYEADTKGEYTFISQAGKSVIDYAVVSEGLINNLVEFRIGNEIISSHMPLLTEIGNITQRKASMKATVEKTGHKLVKCRWEERVKSELLDIMNSNINEYCMNGITLLLQNGKINEAQNILLFSVRRARAKMRCDGRT
jgi:hypothetical protein